MHFFLLNDKYQVIGQKADGYLMQYSDGVEFVFLAIQGAGDERPSGISTAQLTGTPMGATEVLNIFMNWDSFSLEGTTYHGFSCVLPATFTQVAGPLPLNLVLSASDGQVAYSTTFNILVNAASGPTSWIESMNYAQWKEIISYFSADYKNFLRLAGGDMDVGAVVGFPHGEDDRKSLTLKSDGLLLNDLDSMTLATVGPDSVSVASNSLRKPGGGVYLTRYGLDYTTNVSSVPKTRSILPSLGKENGSVYLAYAESKADADLSKYAKIGDIPQGVAILSADQEFTGKNVFSGLLGVKDSEGHMTFASDGFVLTDSDGEPAGISYLPTSADGGDFYLAYSTEEGAGDLSAYLTKSSFDSEKSDFARLSQSNVFERDMTVKGDLTVSGKFTKVTSETIDTYNYTIGLAKGNTKPLTGYVGLYATKYDGTNDGALVFDNTGTAYVGDVTADKSGKITDVSMQPLLTRAEASDLSDKAILFWDADGSKATQLAENGNVWTYGTLSALATKADGLSTDLSAEAKAREQGDKDTLSSSKSYVDGKLADYAKSSALDSYLKLTGGEVTGVVSFSSADYPKKSVAIQATDLSFSDLEANVRAELTSNSLSIYDSSAEPGEDILLTKSGIDYSPKGGSVPQTRSVFPSVGKHVKVYLAYAGASADADLSLYAKKGDLPTGAATLSGDNEFTGKNAFSGTLTAKDADGAMTFGWKSFVIANADGDSYGESVLPTSADGGTFYLAHSATEEGADLSQYAKTGDLSAYVTKAGEETISGTKTFTGRIVSNYSPTDKAEPNVRLNKSGVITIGTYDETGSSAYLMLEQRKITVSGVSGWKSTLEKGDLTLTDGTDTAKYEKNGILFNGKGLFFPAIGGTLVVSKATDANVIPEADNSNAGQALSYAGEGKGFKWTNYGDVYTALSNYFTGNSEYAVGTSVTHDEGSTLKVLGTLNIHGANFPDFPAKGTYLLGYDAGDMAWMDETAYARKTYVDSQDESTLASAKSYTDGKIAGIDYSSYVTNASLAETLKSYVTQTSLTTTLGSYVTDSALTAKLASYVTGASLTETLKGYVTSAALTATLADYAKSSDLGAYLKLAGGEMAQGASIGFSSSSGKSSGSVTPSGIQFKDTLSSDGTERVSRMTSRYARFGTADKYTQYGDGEIHVYTTASSYYPISLPSAKGTLIVSPNGSYSDVTSSKVTITDVSVPSVSAEEVTSSKATLKGTIPVGNADVGDEVTVGTGLTGTKTFVTGVTAGSLTSNETSAGGLKYASALSYTPASASGTDTFAKSISGGSFSQSYASSSKKLVISFTPASVSSAAEAVTGVSGGSASATYAYLHYESAKQSGTGTVGLSTAKIAPAKSAAREASEYSFSDVSSSKVTVGKAVTASKVVATDVTSSKIS